MASLTVRIERQTHKVLQQLAEKEGVTQTQIIKDAVENYRRRRILEQTNLAYAALRRDTKAWNEELEERAQWEATLEDGLEEA